MVSSYHFIIEQICLLNWLKRTVNRMRMVFLYCAHFVNYVYNMWQCSILSSYGLCHKVCNVEKPKRTAFLFSYACQPSSLLRGRLCLNPSLIWPGICWYTKLHICTQIQLLPWWSINSILRSAPCLYLLSFAFSRLIIWLVRLFKS